jgi:hypothetical protein
MIGDDGFRADPATGRGNPDRCANALIGDSMIYGSGLPYPLTFGPALAELGLRACVFGVSGNSPVDYLATLRYVAPRIEPGAHIAFYLYAYNDFVSLRKYWGRGFLSLSNYFPALFEWAALFDGWRQTTLLYSLVRAERPLGESIPWQYNLGPGRVTILYDRDPARYASPKPLNKRQFTALKYFFQGVIEISRDRSWRVSIVIHPDDAEIYANLARGNQRFVDLDPRRAGGLQVCRDYAFVCEDISSYIYERFVSTGNNPYFSNNRHFSAYGTRVVAEHYVALAQRARR